MVAMKWAAALLLLCFFCTQTHAAFQNPYKVRLEECAQGKQHGTGCVRGKAGCMHGRVTRARSDRKPTATTAHKCVFVPDAGTGSAQGCHH